MKNNWKLLLTFGILAGCAEPRYKAELPSPPIFTPAPIWRTPLMCDEPAVLVLVKGDWFKLKNKALFKASKWCETKHPQKPCVKHVTVTEGGKHQVHCVKPNDVFLGSPK